MFTIQPQNPSIEKYIVEIGEEQVEQMILAYLEIKAKFYNASKEKKQKLNHTNFGISDKLHQKILGLKSSSKKSNTEISELRAEISSKFKDDYAHKSIREDKFNNQSISYCPCYTTDYF